MDSGLIPLKKVTQKKKCRELIEHERRDKLIFIQTLFRTDGYNKEFYGDKHWIYGHDIIRNPFLIIFRPGEISAKELRFFERSPKNLWISGLFRNDEEHDRFSYNSHLKIFRDNKPIC